MEDSAVSPELASVAVVDEPVARQLRRLRLWFVSYLVWIGVLFAVALAAFHRYEAGGSPHARALWLLALGAFYLSLCNSLLPLPTAWIVLLLASDDVALVANPWARVALVSLLATTATVMANLNEYHLLGYIFRARLGQRIRRSHVYRWALRWFDVAPFQTLMLVSFVPLPIDFVRWLAILRRYPRPRFAAAYWLGRLPRYVLMAGVAVMLRLSTWQIAWIQIAIVALIGAHFGYQALRRRYQPAAA